MRPSIFSEMKKLRPSGAEAGMAEDGTLGVSLLIPAKNSAHALEATTLEAHRFLRARFARDFEIILIPSPRAANPEDRSLEVAQGLAARLDGVRVVPHLGTVGKGAAIQTGFRASRGRRILFTDADLPYDLSF